MEYTKDMLLNVSYGQTIKKRKGFKILSKILNAVSRHKFITSIVFVTLLFMVLDLILIMSFISILGNAM